MHLRDKYHNGVPTDHFVKIKRRRYEFTDLQTDTEVDADALAALEAELNLGVLTSAGDPPGRWHAYLFVEGLRTTDGRAAEVDAGTWRDLPLPLSWARKMEGGHRGAVTVGAIESITRMEKSGFTLIYAEGSFDLEAIEGTENVGAECARQIALQGGTRWVSGDIEPLETTWCSGETGMPVDDLWEVYFGDGPEPYEVMTSYRIAGATVVSEPAFPQCVIAPEGVALAEVEPLGDEAPEPVPEVIPRPMLVASVHVAETPPREWFDLPELNGPTPLTVTEDGRIYGHIADWNTPHTAYAGQKVHAPRNHSGYAFFLTGELECEGGEKVSVGQLTMGCGHATMRDNPWQAKAHYDGGPGAVQAADVFVGDDKWGICVAGALRPGLTTEQIREFRALAPSGDWRKLNGRLELVACVQVPSPGFPVPRSALAASGADIIDISCRSHYVRIGETDEMEMTALVAAGRVVNDPVRRAFGEMSRRLAALEAAFEERGFTKSEVEDLAAELGL